MTLEEEIRLVQAAIAGDQAAFTTIYAKYEGVARRAVFDVISEDDIDDAVQETFILVHKSLNQFLGDARLSTWIHKIALNVALGFLRKAKAAMRGGDSQTVSIDETFESESGYTIRAVEPAYEDRTVDVNAARDLIEQASVALSETERNTIGMILEGYGPTEIVAMCGVSLPAAKSMIWRAKKNLRIAIENLQRKSLSRTHRSGGVVVLTYDVLVDPNQVDEYISRVLQTKAVAVDTETAALLTSGRTVAHQATGEEVNASSGLVA